MSKHDAAHWREWRAANKERANAYARKRRENETPEKRARRLAAKAAYYRKTHGSGKTYKPRGTPYLPASAMSLKGKTPDELRAHKSALQAKWTANHPTYLRDWMRKARATKEGRAKLRRHDELWKDRHYQKHLECSRNAKRRKCEAEGRVYKPRPSTRLPEWVTCRAHARHLARVGAARMMAQAVSVGRAIQSGLAVGRRAGA